MRWILILLLALTLPVWAESPTPQLLEQFAREVERERVRWQTPAVAVGLVEDGKLTWFQGFGSKSEEDPAPPDADTLFAIGSASKAFGATTLAIAVDQGKASWDDRMMDRDPSFAMADPWVTREFRLFDLYSQHPGVQAYALSALLSLGYSQEKLMAAWRHVPPNGHFRATFAYVNIPHLFAGKLVAELFQKPDWETSVEELVLKPLGMNRTSGRPEVLSWPNRAPGHVLVEGKARHGEGGAFPFNAGPAGSLSSTVNDLTRWIHFQCGDGAPLLSQENLLRTRLVQTMVDDRTGYAMGWGVAFRSPTPLIWHTGGTLTHACIVAFEPDQKRGLIILTNLGGQNIAQPLAYRFFDLVHGETGPNPVEQAWELRLQAEAQANKPNPAISFQAPATDLIGRYESPILGPVKVGANYSVVLEEIQLRCVLKPIAGDAFWLVTTEPHWVELGLEELFILHFVRDAEGRVTGVRAQQEGGIGLNTVLPRYMTITDD